MLCHMKALSWCNFYFILVKMCTMDIHRVFLNCITEHRLYHKASQYLLGHPMTTAGIRTGIKESLSYLCTNFREK